MGTRMGNKLLSGTQERRERTGSQSGVELKTRHVTRVALSGSRALLCRRGTFEYF